MSDYSFMKSGSGNVSGTFELSDDFKEDISILMSYFIEKSAEVAAKYSNYCGRNGVTKKDLEYGMKYQVFEIGGNLAEIDRIREEFREDMENCECEEYIDDDGTPMDYTCEYCLNKDKEAGIDDMIVPDHEIDEFEIISGDKINESNREFINKVHCCYLKFPDWEPETLISQKLKEAIIAMS